MEDSLFHLGYISQAINLMTPSELQDLLAVARSNNSKEGISGMLLYSSGAFLQVLEGPESAINKTLNSIRHDTRHHSIQILFQEPIEKRQFSSWSMGFHHLSNKEAGQTPGMNYFLQGKEKLDKFFIEDGEAGEKLKQVLHSFKKEN